MAAGRLDGIQSGRIPCAEADASTTADAATADATIARASAATGTRAQAGTFLNYGGRLSKRGRVEPAGHDAEEGLRTAEQRPAFEAVAGRTGIKRLPRAAFEAFGISRRPAILPAMASSGRSAGYLCAFVSP